MVIQVGVKTAKGKFVKHRMGRPHWVVGTAQKNKPVRTVRALVHGLQGGETRKIKRNIAIFGYDMRPNEGNFSGKVESIQRAQAEVVMADDKRVVV